MNNRIVLFTLIIVVFIVSFYYYTRPVQYDDFLSGIWMARPDYCKEAEIDSLMINIDASNNSCYVIMEEDGVPVISQLANLDINPTSKTATTNIDFLPESFQIDLDKDNGHMLFRLNDTILADLVKDNEASLLNLSLKKELNNDIEKIF